MSKANTLKDALKEEGHEEQIEILTDEAKNLTKEEVVEILNTESHNLSSETIESLRKLVRIRIKNGQSVVPWKDLEGVQINRTGNKKGVFGW